MCARTCAPGREEARGCAALAVSSPGSQSNPVRTMAGSTRDPRNRPVRASTFPDGLQAPRQLVRSSRGPGTWDFTFRVFQRGNWASRGSGKQGQGVGTTAQGVWLCTFPQMSSSTCDHSQAMWPQAHQGLCRKKSKKSSTWRRSLCPHRLQDT